MGYKIILEGEFHRDPSAGEIVVLGLDDRDELLPAKPRDPRNLNPVRLKRGIHLRLFGRGNPAITPLDGRAVRITIETVR